MTLSGSKKPAASSQICSWQHLGGNEARACSAVCSASCSSTEVRTLDFAHDRSDGVCHRVEGISWVAYCIAERLYAGICCLEHREKCQQRA